MAARLASRPPKTPRLSPLPDVGEMARKAARNDEDGVDPKLVALAHVARREPLSGDDYSAQAVGVERESGGVLGRPRLDLDERQSPAATSDDVDLAAGNPGAAGDDPPAVQPEPKSGEGLGAAAAFFRRVSIPGAVHFAAS